jgi:hypothetical protein
MTMIYPRGRSVERVGSFVELALMFGVRTSYGAGLRVHNRTSTVGRVDIGHGPEGWRAVFRISDPFKQSTMPGGRTEVIPFVP